MKTRLLLATALVAGMGIFAATAAATQTTTTNPANAPNGTHYKSGSPTATCTVSGDGSVSCNSYTLGGVGNIDATEQLTATYTATVVCRNNGGNLSDSQHQGSFSKSTGPIPLSSTKNGYLTVNAASQSAPSDAQFVSQQTCPNPGWTPEVSGAITLQSFDYTLTFAGFSGPYIEISGNDP